MRPAHPSGQASMPRCAPANAPARQAIESESPELAAPRRIASTGSSGKNRKHSRPVASASSATHPAPVTRHGSAVRSPSASARSSRSRTARHSSQPRATNVSGESAPARLHSSPSHRSW